MNSSLARLRRPSIDDIPEIEDIAKSYTSNPLPDKFETAAVIERYGDVVAFGVLRSNIEALFYCSGDIRDRVESLKGLMDRAVDDALSLGHDDIYVFAQDEEFAAILIKHFGFRRAKGVPLILDLDSVRNENGQ